MSKSISKAGEVTLEMGIDYPLRVHFKLGQSVEINYLLAPLALMQELKDITITLLHKKQPSMFAA